MFRTVFSIAVLGTAVAWDVAEGTRLPEVTAAGVAAGQTCFRGEIIFVEKSQLVISMAGQYVRFLVADDARITLDRIEAALDDLQPRSAVTIRADMKGQEPIAKSIDATTRM